MPRSRLIFALLIAWLTVCAGLAYLFDRTARDQAIRDLDRRREVHAAQAAAIEDLFSSWAVTLQAAAQEPSIAVLDDRGRRLMDFLLATHRQHIRAFTRVDAEGKILHTVPLRAELIGVDLSPQPHVARALREQRPVVSDSFDAVQGYSAIALHVPVRRGDRFLGTIAVLLDFQAIAERYLEPIRIGGTGAVRLVTSAGTELFCPLPDHVGRSVFENHKDCPSLLAMTKKMLEGGRGRAEYSVGRIGDSPQELVT